MNPWIHTSLPPSFHAQFASLGSIGSPGNYIGCYSVTDGDTWYTTTVVLAVVDSSPTNLVASSAVSASFDYTISFANAVATPEAEIRLTTSSCLIPAGAYSYRCEACFLICVCVRARVCACARVYAFMIVRVPLCACVCVFARA